MRAVPLLTVLLLATPALAEPYAVGSLLPPLELADQHGVPQRLDDSVRLVLFSRDMQGGDVIKETLAEGGPAFLERHDAVYIADVSGMPGLVRRLMAKPAMRRRAYPMWLDEEGEVTADLPSRAGRPTLLFLQERRVVRIEHPDSADALRAAVEPPPDDPEAQD